MAIIMMKMPISVKIAIQEVNATTQLKMLTKKTIQERRNISNQLKK